MPFMSFSALPAQLLSEALTALDAATADLDLVAVIASDPALAVDAVVLAEALAAEAHALETVIARRIGR